ncbi:NmrA family transcriptional regulator [Streptomyces sp. CMB-StM0423]|uniref:NmrA family transcriptional regulator n=1 Tax=Streptomyces sp. CMB-StM0423 TaxID=2059884 RepID=UPI000C703CBB|nr:NmrA family transcriptional regulator [Streptomyces sp. CMB-StM0423]AUH40587.1 NmrA family transcriptional regulator [Streptomyces sp. CMB-StM0423]
MTRHDLTLVTGGTGKTGGRLVHLLTGRDLPVRIGSRSGGVPFDWEDRATWGPALDGVRSVYLSYYPDLAVPGAPEVVGAFAELAVAKGARRLVLLSGRGEEEAAATEKAVAATGADLTVLRAAWFMQNFSESYLLDPVLAGEVALPAGDVREPFVDADDIAAAAVAALTEDGHVGRTYELTGPRLLTFAEAVAEIAAATGRDLSYVTIPLADFTGGLAAEGAPQEVSDLLTYLFTSVLDGRNAHLDDGVGQLLGRPARDFAGYARATAATGVWNPENAS